MGIVGVLNPLAFKRSARRRFWRSLNWLVDTYSLAPLIL